jgi:hypothetical protein
MMLAASGGEPELPTIRILVFGDGNFSFGAALARLLKGKSGVDLVVTSFDDEEALKVGTLLSATWCSK